MDNIIKVDLQGSKSILNRVLMISTFLETPLKITNDSQCNDVITLKRNLEKLGLNFQKKENSMLIIPSLCLISGLLQIKTNKKQPQRRYPLYNDEQSFFVKESATGLRFLISRLASLENLVSEINVSSQLAKRPIKPLLQVIRRFGADISETYPLKIKGSKLSGGRIGLNSDISSQFISSLLLIAPVYRDDLLIKLSGKIVSKPYIIMTLKIMEHFGIQAELSQNEIFIKKGQNYTNPSEYEIEPDFSSACYFWALGALSDKFIYTSSTKQKSLQADFCFLDIIKKMGAEISLKKDLIGVRRGELKGINVDMKDLPDQVPTLAVLALLANSKTSIKNIEHLKYKESDRINSLLKEIRKLGGKADFSDNTLNIYPLSTNPGKVKIETSNDHRIAMAFHILKSKYPKIEIINPGCATKSFPNFIREFEHICNSA